MLSPEFSFVINPSCSEDTDFWNSKARKWPLFVSVVCCPSQPWGLTHWIEGRRQEGWVKEIPVNILKISSCYTWSWVLKIWYTELCKHGWGVDKIWWRRGKSPGYLPVWTFLPLWSSPCQSTPILLSLLCPLQSSQTASYRWRSCKS